MPESPSPLQSYLGLLPGANETEVLRLLVELGATISGADEGSLLVYDEDKNELVFAMTIGNLEAEEALIGQTVPMGKGISGQAAMTREPQIGRPVFKDVHMQERTETDSHLPEQVLAAPMLIQDMLVGVITAVTFNPTHAFTTSHIKLFSKFASIAGVVVDQKRRLNALSKKQSEEKSQLLGQAGKDEEAIMTSLQRIVSEKPEALEELATIMAAIKNLATG